MRDVMRYVLLVLNWQAPGQCQTLSVNKRSRRLLAAKQHYGIPTTSEVILTTYPTQGCPYYSRVTPNLLRAIKQLKPTQYKHLLQHLIIPTTMGYSSRGKGVSLGTSGESTHFYFRQWNYTVLHLLEERQSVCVPTFVGIKGLPKQSTTCAVVFSSILAKNYRIPM